MSHSRADRTYYVSDARLVAFARLSVAERLQWVEELANFLRLAKKRPTPAPRPVFDAVKN